MPILRGTLRGWSWLPGSGGRVLHVLLGAYERTQSARFARQISPGSVVFDVGAHAGYYTLLASLRAGPRGRIFAFEPSPRNLRYLHAHLRLNRCANVEVIEKAVAAGEREVEFAPAPWPATGTGHLAAAGALRVQAVGIDGFVAGGAPPPAVLKIDVEGAELRVLEGARATLARDRPVIFLSTHGREVRAACSALLRSLGYRIESLGARGEELDELLCTPDQGPG